MCVCPSVYLSIYLSVRLFFLSSDCPHRKVAAAEVAEFERSTGLVVLPITNRSSLVCGGAAAADGRESIKVSKGTWAVCVRGCTCVRICLRRYGWVCVCRCACVCLQISTTPDGTTVPLQLSSTSHNQITISWLLVPFAYSRNKEN